MKLVLQDKNQLVLSFDKDEEVIEGLGKFMAEQNIGACVFSGLGACKSAEIAYFNIHVKDYRKKPYFDEMEILSLTGNGSLLDGKPAIHAHGVFGHNDFTTIGGHVFKLVVSATCEIFLTKLEGKMERKMNADFNLNTLA